METLKLLSSGEPAVERILLRQCQPKGYGVYPKMRLSDVIGRSRGEFLPARDFDYFCRAHLDFVIAKDHRPIVAVEFDGRQHFVDPKTRERDVIKHRLCRAADLPVLRVTAAEIAAAERLTLLDYIIMRHVAWREQIPGIRADIAEFSAALGPDVTFEDVELELDPGFQFDLRHPYPGSATICQRLWSHYQMAWEGDPPDRCGSASLLYAVRPFRLDSFENDGFVTCEMKPCVWRNEQGSRAPLFESQVKVSIRSWLPLQVDIPPAFVTIVGPGAVPPDQAMELLTQRQQAIWEPHVPGAHVFDIAENYARYKGYRAIEQWARRRLAH